MGGDLRVGEEKRESSESREHLRESAPALAKFIPAALTPTRVWLRLWAFLVR